jgi:hypothetical protein
VRVFRARGSRAGDEKCKSMIGATWTARDIVILVRSLSDGTTRSRCIVAFLCTYGTQSAHPVCVNKTTLFLFQPSATTAISPLAGNMRINRRKINTRNANTRICTGALLATAMAAPEVCFSPCNYHASSTSISSRIIEAILYEATKNLTIVA